MLPQIQLLFRERRKKRALPARTAAKAREDEALVLGVEAAARHRVVVDEIVLYQGHQPPQARVLPPHLPQRAANLPRPTRCVNVNGRDGWLVVALVVEEGAYALPC